ncbi:hypothetical protein [Streptomyces sp. NPDC059788]
MNWIFVSSSTSCRSPATSSSYRCIGAHLARTQLSVGWKSFSTTSPGSA